MNPGLKQLQPYPFAKLRTLLQDVEPAVALRPIDLSIGEPQHAPPECVLQALSEQQELIGKYPLTAGLPQLRQSMATWLMQRYPALRNKIDADTQVLPVNGTREALFAIAQTVVNHSEEQLVLMPNPFYQIYEGAALLAGAKPVYVDFSVRFAEVPALHQVTTEVWEKCSLLYVCSPANPSGEVIPELVFKQLIELAHRHDFIIVSDECYSEIYFDESNPPNGLLHACQTSGNEQYSRCLACYSLSKRSNVPGLRSGMVAGDARLISAFLQYRTYHGCAMPLPAQHASIAAWNDEPHVITNRALYRDKFIHAAKHLANLPIPAGGFYIWLPTPVADTEFSRSLYQEYAVKTLPGSYLSRTVDKANPGKNFVRIALVATLEECEQGIMRVSELFHSLLT